MKKVLLASALAMVVSGCSNTLTPVRYAVEAPRTQPTTVCTGLAVGQTFVSTATGNLASNSPERMQLQWYSCALRARADENLQQAQRWFNGGEWRNLPLLAAAGTIAGLLLFGRRDGENNLTPGTQEAISIAGFGAASFSAFANYLNPDNARRLLRQGARGHFCMASQSELILSVWDDVTAVQAARNSLRDELALLETAIAAAPANAAGRNEAIQIRGSAYQAIALYDTQRRALLNSYLHLGESAWDFGLDLMSSADRQPVDVAGVVETLTEQARANARFEEADEADPSVPGPTGQTGSRGFVASQNLSTSAQLVAGYRRALLNNLPNVQALVLGFDTCAATALLGGDPRIARVQRVEFE
jgi:hypothetical protein